MEKKRLFDNRVSCPECECIKLKSLGGCEHTLDILSVRGQYEFCYECTDCGMNFSVNIMFTRRFVIVEKVW